MNKWTFTGRLINDPMYRDVAGVRAASFTVSVRTRGKDDSGYPKSVLVRCTCWRKLAELCEKFEIGKGKTLALCGMVDLTEYTSKQTGEKRCSLEVDLEDIDFLLGSKGEAGAPETPAEAPAVGQGAFMAVDETVPF